MMLAFGAAGAALGSAAGSALAGGAMMPLWYGQLASGIGWSPGVILPAESEAPDDDDQ